MIIKWRLTIAAVAALIALGGTAQADILTAGPAYGGSGQLNGRVFCWLFNTGSSGATIPTRQIWNSLKVLRCTDRRFMHRHARGRKVLLLFHRGGHGHLYLPGDHQRR